MATGPLKSQPLHNFMLSLPKWGNRNQVNNHRQRKRDSPPTDRRSPPSEAESESDQDGRRGALLGSTAARTSGTLIACSSVERSKKQNESMDVEEKPWNLRPRRTPVKVAAADACGRGGGSELHPPSPSPAPPPARVTAQSESLPKSMRLRGFAEAHGSDKREKKRFWISLSKDEIEEDIFVMTGSKPARRPKKRTKTVQKNLDCVFPGLWLIGVAPDAYRLPDAPSKR